MNELVPEDHDVVVVASRPGEGDARRFAVESPREGEAPSLPEGLVHERDLVDHMRTAGFRLTMVGGGSRSDETRRFYFRPA